MIELQKMKNQNFRTFGWVQDPSDFSSLYKVVSIFNCHSEVHKELVEHKINDLVEERDGKNKLIDALKNNPLKIKYIDLVGTSFTPRKMARCNGIVQVTVKGQKREFISDWPADNFVRWAHCLGFIKYNYFDDTFEITESGLKWTNTLEDSTEYYEILEEAVLSYPPAIRILKLLSDGEIMTKFELGKHLGFIGEDGFTSIPQNILVMTLATTTDLKEKNKLRTDTEGSSDKYARMIAKWLSKLGLVKQISKEIQVKVENKLYKEKIGQSYMITAKGLKAINKAEGKSKFRKISKNVCWEMMATKGIDRNYIRTRRTMILKILAESKKTISLEAIKDRLNLYGISELKTVIEDDIQGLINIGISIACKNKRYIINDTINDFIIPIIVDTEKSEYGIEKDKLREKMDFLSHEYLSLIDLAFDSKQNRLFEMKVIELLTSEGKYNGLHLGGSRRPDGIIYTTDLEENYGVIIDTKAYSKGYNLPISQVDEMIRYVDENNRRDKKQNKNEWWNEFDKDVNKFYYSFISGKFTGNIEEKLQRITIFTDIYGNAIKISTLLYIINEIKAKRTSKRDIIKYFNDKIY